ncbi:MAG: hypothetical protein JKY13_02675 [Gammaproteobacteria bacterium]|nr:hypothetical protein [Gammaproteobacteria bacterium]
MMSEAFFTFIQKLAECFFYFEQGLLLSTISDVITQLILAALGIKTTLVSSKQKITAINTLNELVKNVSDINTTKLKLTYCRSFSTKYLDKLYKLTYQQPDLGL